MGGSFLSLPDGRATDHDYDAMARGEPLPFEIGGCVIIEGQPTAVCPEWRVSVDWSEVSGEVSGARPTPGMTGPESPI
jgi:hypothetical protein